MVWVYLIFSVAVLLISAEMFVRQSIRLSTFLKLSPLIIGTTIVAIGTSLPELVVSLIAILNHDSGLALGNIIGSNIINILFVLPIGVLVGKLHIGTVKTQRNTIILLAVTLVFIFMLLFKTPLVVSGILLLVMAVFFTANEYFMGIKGREHEDHKVIKAYKNSDYRHFHLFALLFSMVGIIIGGIFTVNFVEQISVIYNLSTSFLGLSLIAFATSLPEMLTSIISQEDHQDKITLGNILGSNIYNILLIGGLVMIFTSIASFTLVEISFLLITKMTLIFIIIYYKNQYVPKWVSIFLLGMGVIYFISLNYI